MAQHTLDHVQHDQSSLGTSQNAMSSSTGEAPLTLEALRTFLTAAQDTIIAKTTVAIAAAQADLRNYIKDEFATLEARVIVAEKRLERFPLQLCNSRMPFNSPLQYPAGMQIVKGMPIHKRDIFNLLESDCVVTAQALDLPELPGEPTVAQRRAQIGEFLGVM